MVDKICTVGKVMVVIAVAVITLTMGILLTDAATGTGSFRQDVGPSVLVK